MNANQKNHHFAGEQPARLFAFPELVSVAQRCISFPSLSGREEELIKYLIRVASRLNFSSVGTDRMGNLIAEAKIGNGRGPKIVLTGHTDVVNADTSSWNPETRPWTGSIREGRLYGRGAVDMKSSLVAMLFAVGGLSLLPEGCNGKIEVIGYGPGEEEDAHTVDESIRLSGHWENPLTIFPAYRYSDLPVLPGFSLITCYPDSLLKSSPGELPLPPPPERSVF